MSYKSPIEIEFEDPMTSIIAHIQKNNEMKIMATINQYVSVDKEELIKALNYDRQQYIKGYADAKAEYQRPQGEWITVHYSREELNVPQKASMFDFVKCPFCETIHQGRHNFCSRCGADMRGKEK